MRKIFLFILIFSWSVGVAQKTFQSISSDSISFSEEDVLHTVYLIGDAGDDPRSNVELRKNLKKNLELHEESSIFFLGDNIYPHGMHKKSSKHRYDDEKKIEGQLEIVKKHKGRKVFIPGNHDWKQGKDGGHKYVKRQQKFVEKYLNDDDSFVPDGACPGPEVIEVSEDLAIIVIDTQWWIHTFEKPRGEKDDCSVQNTEQFMLLFKDALRKYRRRNVIVVGHHPLYSNGEHGGKFPLKQHLFPLTAVSKGLYIPLPVIGSIYPGYRAILGDRQDIQHPKYAAMKREIVYAISQYENVVYAAGHEHNLQYKVFNQNHHIVSGAGSKSTYLAKNKQIEFGSEEKGYSRLSYLKSGEVWMEFINEEGKRIFTKHLYDKTIKHSGSPAVPVVSYEGQTQVVVPEPGYAAGKFKRTIFGDLNRDLWTTPIEVPYLDIHTVHGGLSPIKQGGGMQSVSLRMKGGDGHQYVLRKIRKDATLLVDKNLRQTAAKTIVYDEIAGSHPYASIVIPSLAKSIGIYSTDPSLVFVPDDLILGDFQDIFGGSFCLIEERPDGDMSDFAQSGASEKVVSYSKTIEKTHEKYHHIIDERFVLKSRLTDILIGDWDRHDDQWRWATFKNEDWTVYRPIPRDRDQAFFQFDGIVPSVANRKWMLRKFQNWDKKTRDMAGLNYNARFFDRAFLSSLDRQDWKEITQEIKVALSDAEIDKALALFASEVDTSHTAFVASTLKYRRDDLTNLAEEYYEILAKKVDVVGKLKSDYFEVVRHKDGRVEVSIYPYKKGEKVESERYFHRLFDRRETKEIRLYGLGGEDHYDISGQAKKSIKVRVIAGYDKDFFDDKSLVKGGGKKTLIYDSEKRKGAKNIARFGNETKTFLVSEKKGMEYVRREFKYNKLTPLPYVGSNPDDGVFVGLKATHIKHGFKKSPYAIKQTFGANVATRTDAYNLLWKLDAKSVLKSLDMGLKFEFNNPFVFRYTGTGNEPFFVANTADTRVRYKQVTVDPYFGFSSGSGASVLRFGPRLQYIDLKAKDQGDQLTIPDQEDLFLGASVSYEYRSTDSQVEPWRGIHFKTLLRTNSSANQDLSFTQVNSSLATYMPLQWMPLRTTLALRSAVGRNWGDFAFYQAQFLGGQKELRGIGRNRYSGSTAFYNNAEVRVAFRKADKKVRFIGIGALAHFDYGRVWAEGENSNLWHRSYGGGLYFNVLNVQVININYSVSDINDAIIVGTALFF